MAYSISTALAIYFVLWWVVLFVTLPFGVRSQHEDGEGAPGTAIFLIGIAGHQAIGLLHGGWIHRGSRGADRRKQQKY